MSGRWSCATCGSTEVTAVFEGIVTARFDPARDRPAMGEVVQGFHPHDDGMTPCEGSIQCADCGGGEVIYDPKAVDDDD